MRTFLPYMWLSLFTSLSPVLIAQSGFQSPAFHLAQLMEHCHNNGMFNGTILVAKDGKIIFEKAYGMANQEKNETLTPEHAFYLASVSKQFTTMAIMILQEQGKLSYDDPLSKYFPEFPDYADGVTIRHMMNHTSGIPDHYRLGIGRDGLSNADVLETLVKQEHLDFPPGSKYSYSNGAYVLLSMIAEKASGETFADFMAKNIFQPLKMKHTRIVDQAHPVPEMRAIGYDFTGQLADYTLYTTGAGGMFGTVGDLFRWERGLAAGKLVSEATLQEAYTPTILTDGDTSYYGYGWRIARNENAVFHSGGLAGYRTFLFRELDSNSSFMFLTNQGDAVAMGGINDAIVNILKGESYDLPPIPASAILAKKMQDSPVEDAIKEVRTQLDAKPDQIEVDEAGLNTLGYAFLGKEEYETAIAIFQFTIALFPNAFNPYDSQGEAYMLSGDTAQAITFYEKSLELNPNNENARTMLRKMGQEVEERPALQLAEALLDTYAGEYQLAPNFSLVIRREGQRMLIQATGQEESEIFAMSETRFYSKVVDAQLTFQTDEEGAVTGLILHQGGDFPAKKLK